MVAAWRCLIFRRMLLIGRFRKKTFQLVAANWILQFTYGFSFDLTHAFTCYLEDTSNFFQRVGVTVSQAISQTNDFTFTICKSLQ